MSCEKCKTKRACHLPPQQRYPGNPNCLFLTQYGHGFTQLERIKLEKALKEWRQTNSKPAINGPTA